MPHRRAVRGPFGGADRRTDGRRVRLLPQPEPRGRDRRVARAVRRAPPARRRRVGARGRPGLCGDGRRRAREERAGRVADADVDLEREQRSTEMGVPDALGADAAAILALIGQAETAARAQHPVPPGLGRQGGDAGEARGIRIVPGPVRGVPRLPDRRRPGDRRGRARTRTTRTSAPTVPPRPSGGMTAVSEVHTVLDASFAGSDVKVELDTDIHDERDRHDDRLAGDDRDAAGDDRRRARRLPERRGPRAGIAGRDLGRGGQHVRRARARVGSHATGSQKRSSTFAGTSDDSATLGSVTQSFTSDEQYKRSASADGGPEATQEGRRLVHRERHQRRRAARVARASRRRSATGRARRRRARPRARSRPA